jgi:hypothetical protein
MAKETEIPSRGGRRESLFFAVIKRSALAQAPPAARAATDCPAAPRNHVPRALRDEKLSIGRIQKLLLDYHRRYDDIDIVAVFDMAPPSSSGTGLKKPALLFVTDESHLQTGLICSLKISEFIAGGSCDRRSFSMAASTRTGEICGSGAPSRFF